MCSIRQKTFSKILLGQVWRVTPLHDWLELVLVNCPNHLSLRWELSQKNQILISWDILLFTIRTDFIITISNEILLEITKYELV